MKQTTEAVVEIADRAMEAAEDAMQKCRAAAGKLLGQTICAIMEQEIMLQLRERRMADAHYANARNGYKRKTLTSNFGSIQTRVPQDRSSDYEPILIGKYRKDVRDIEGAIFRLYAGGKAARLTAAKALYGVLAKRELSEAIVNAIEPTACEIWSRPVEPELAQLPAYTPTRDDLTNLAGQKAPFAFALGNATNDAGEQPAAPVLSDRSLVSLNNALSYYDNNGYEASYLIMDLGTGRGIAGNVDVPIYGASSFKGPYCAYVVNKEFPNDIDRASSSRLTQVENTIVWSDNSSYGKLRRTYGNDGMEAWLAEAGVDTALVNDTYFPTYTARQSALMWLKIYEYLTTADTSAAQWLSDTFGKTEVSFLRNGALGTTSAGHTDYLPEEGSGGEEGVEDDGSDEEGSEESTAADGSEGDGSVLTEDAEGGQTLIEEDKTVASIGTNITVRNKAGWIDGQDDDAVCDSGIVTINGRDYLITIMTNAPDSAAGEQAFAHLARTLLEIRGDLV